MLCTPWVSAEDDLDCVPPLDPAPEPAEIERAGLLASQLLYVATGGQFPGVCIDTIEACGSCGVRACGCATGRCAEGDYLEPPGTPIINIATATIDGTEVAAGRLEIENDRRLILLTTGAAPHGWGTDWTLTYRFGSAPPAYLAEAARLLRCQLLAGWAGGDCDIPEHVVASTREAVSYEWQTIEQLAGSVSSFGNVTINQAVKLATAPVVGGTVLVVSDFLHPRYRRTRPVTYVPVS